MLKLTYILIISACLLSCGQQPLTGQPQTSPSPSPEGVSKPEETKPVTGVTGFVSLYLKDYSSRPQCLPANVQQLIYVISVMKFYTCSGTDWVEVDIKGQAGSKGESGKDGVTTTIIKQEVTEKLVNGNMWYDPIAKKYWLIPANENTSSAASALAVCGDTSWRLPTYDELQAAIARGLKYAADSIGGPREAWIKGSGDINFHYYVIVRANANISDNLAGYYCVEK